MILFLFCVISSFLVSSSLGFASVTSHSDKLSLKHFSNNYLDKSVCLQEAECIDLNNNTCFGTLLPYSSTSKVFVEDSLLFDEVKDQLDYWQGLRSIPRCWAVVQPLLCAVYMPKCENGSVFLPSQEMCRITRGPCKSVKGWPPFLQCENKELFPPKCRNPLQEVKFNTSYKCVSPLVETDNPDNWFNQVEGCGIQCQDPFFTKEEHNSTHSLISILASVSLCTTLFSVVTFVISWKFAKRYPGVIIFYINLCLAIMSFGWLIQFFPGAREELVCSYDGTIQRKQPRSGEHLCSITFVLIYYFLMAAIVWFVILTYAWYVLFKQIGTPKDIVKKKVAYFHIVAWSIPLVLTTTVMAMNEVDGDSMRGICFVGYANMNMRLSFLLAPIGLAAIIGGGFLACVLYTLIKLKSDEVANLYVKKKICRLILKIGVFSAFAVVLIICTFACHVYDFQNRNDWDESLREYIVCLAENSANSYSKIGESSKCLMKSKPSIGVVRIHLFCVFGFGIIMSLWVWTRETQESWNRFFCRRNKDSAALAKHQLIAKLFQHPHGINQGHGSFSLNSTHDDPVGMNLDANSVASRDTSSSWAAALPHFLDRRNAVAGVTPFSPRHYSSASDMSHISLDSFNQPNLDSLSMQISEQEFVAHALRHQRRKTRKDRERFLKANRIAPRFPGNGRGSDTSLQSSLRAASFAVAGRKAGVDAKVIKSTSTGDLGIPHSQPMPFLPIMMLSVNNRPLIQRPAINPPFTHGMTDNSHRLDNRVPSVASVLPGASSSQRFTPNPCSMLPNPLMGMFQPMYGGNYEEMLSMPYGYLGGSMYPSMNGIYDAYNTLAYTAYNAMNNQHQADILPMYPMVDSASETESFPIRISDESQLMTTQRLIQAQNAAVSADTAAISASSGQPKPGLEPQACAKTQFLQRMGSFNTKTNSAALRTLRPLSRRKSSHNEAPPSYRAASIKSLNDEELDNVFNENVKE